MMAVARHRVAEPLGAAVPAAAEASVAEEM
jgi:hypothetical protein